MKAIEIFWLNRSSINILDSARSRLTIGTITCLFPILLTGLKRSRRSDSSEISDLETPVKASKTLRSRKIKPLSDTDDGPIEISDSADEPRRTQNRKGKLDRLDKLSKSRVSPKLRFSACPSKLTCEDLANKNSKDLATMAYNWLDDIELGHAKPTNLHGVISGCMKERIAFAY